LVQSDVRNEYITLEQAEQDYGVVLDRDTLEIKRLREMKRRTKARR
jgi:N-methylhydantoinase B